LLGSASTLPWTAGAALARRCRTDSTKYAIPKMRKGRKKITGHKGLNPAVANIVSRGPRGALPALMNTGILGISENARADRLLTLALQPHIHSTAREIEANSLVR
jgi:hypothetical protein